MEYELDDYDERHYKRIIDTDNLEPLVQLCSECKVPMKPTGKLYLRKRHDGTSGKWHVESICPKCNEQQIVDDPENRDIVQRIAEAEMKKLGY